MSNRDDEGVDSIIGFMNEYGKSLEAEQGAFRLIVTSDIHRQMASKGVSKAELARRLETSRANVTMMLSGDRNLTLDKIYEIYHHLGEKPAFGIEKTDEWKEAGVIDNNKAIDLSEEVRITGAWHFSGELLEPTASIMEA